MAWIYDTEGNSVWEGDPVADPSGYNSGEQAVDDILFADENLYSVEDDTQVDGPDGTNAGEGYIFYPQVDGPDGANAGEGYVFDGGNDGQKTLSDYVAAFGKSAMDALTKRYYSNGSINWGNVIKDAAMGLGAYASYRAAQTPNVPTGYQGGIPERTAIRDAVPTAPGLRPGAGGQRYFTDVIQGDKNGVPLKTPTNVAELYRQYLGRSGEPEGIAYWANQFGPEVDAAERSAFLSGAIASGEIPAGSNINPASTHDVSAIQRDALAFANRQAAAARAQAAPAQTPDPNSDRFFGREQSLAVGGEVGLTGGMFVLPADVVSGLGNGNSNRGASVLQAQLGDVQYLNGDTDGMADQIPANIDGTQRAAVAHGEVIVPAGTVARIGGGDIDKGTQSLYSMMDSVRKMRTGSPKQGKEINAERVVAASTGGGLKALAAGGPVKHFADGATVPTGVTGREESLSNWVGSYVTDMLADGKALAELPYTAYSGPLTAGDSALQTQAFNNAANLATPAVIGQSATAASQAGSALGDLAANSKSTYAAPTAGYSSAEATAAKAQTATADARGYTATPANGYGMQNATLGAAPSMQAAQFSGPSDVRAPNLQNFSMQAATGQYDPSGLNQYQMGPASDVTTQDFRTPGTASSFMSPYIQNVVDIQTREAQRAADVATTQRQSEQTQRGAYGGSRAAIMDAEAARNLATQKGDITARGLQSAYEQAQSQFNAQQQQGLTAQQANQNAGLTVGRENLGANLSVQGLGANLGSQYGLASLSNQQQANSQNLNSWLQTQGLGAQTGMQAQLANQNMGYNTAAQNAQMQQQAWLANQALAGQYGITEGQFLQQAYGQTSAQMQQSELANAGYYNQAGQFGAQAENQASLANAGYANQTSQANAQLAQQASIANQQAANQAAQFKAQQDAASAQFAAQQDLAAQRLSVDALNAQVAAAGTAGNLGVAQNQTGIANLNTQLTAGGVQQGTEQAGITADINAFNQERANPYNMVTYQQSLLNGLPLASQSYNTAPVDPLQAAISGASGIAGLYKTFT